MKKVWIVVAIIIALGIIGGGVYYFMNRNSDDSNVNMQAVKNNIVLSDVKSIKIVPSVLGYSSFSEYEITNKTEISRIVSIFNGMQQSSEYEGTSGFLSVNIQLINGDYYDVWDLDSQKNMITIGLAKANGDYSQGVYISKDFSDYIEVLKDKLRK